MSVNACALQNQAMASNDSKQQLTKDILWLLASHPGKLLTSAEIRTYLDQPDVTTAKISGAIRSAGDAGLIKEKRGGVLAYGLTAERIEIVMISNISEARSAIASKEDLVSDAQTVEDIAHSALGHTVQVKKSKIRRMNALVIPLVGLTCLAVGLV